MTDQVAQLGVEAASGIGQDHGIVGALHLRDPCLRESPRDDSTVQVDDYEPVIAAIALHNLRRGEDRIVFVTSHWRFCLLSATSLQGWEQATFGLLYRAGMVVGPASGLNAHSGDWRTRTSLSRRNWRQNQLPSWREISLAFPPGKRRQRRKLSLCATYTDLVNWNSGVCLTWLDAT